MRVRNLGGWHLSGSSLSQKIVFSLICVAVVLLLAPYAGCHVDQFEGGYSDKEQEHESTRHFPSPHREQGRDEAVTREAQEPLGQIEELLSK